MDGKTNSENSVKNPVSEAALKGGQNTEIQPFGTIVRLPIALEAKACAASVNNLNQVLADTMTLRDLYKKHHWQTSGPTFQPLHLLFDKHFQEQSGLVDLLAERVQTLGGVSLAMAPDVAEATIVPRAPKGRENPSAQLRRLLHAHEIVLEETRAMARQADEDGDQGTNDLLVGDVMRGNELQVWFLAQHLMADSLSAASDATAADGAEGASPKKTTPPLIKTASPSGNGQNFARVMTSHPYQLSEYTLRTNE